MVRLRRVPWPTDLDERVRAAAAADGIRRDEILAAIESAAGWAAGTRSAAYLPVPTDRSSDEAYPSVTAGEGSESASGLRRVAWERFERAEWSAERSMLQLWETAPFGAPMRHTDLVVDDPGRFGQLVRERINASVLVQRHVPLVGKRGVRVVGRRSPSDPEPEVVWSLVLDTGLDPDRPGLLDGAEAALRQVRDEFGM